MHEFSVTAMSHSLAVLQLRQAPALRCASCGADFHPEDAKALEEPCLVNIGGSHVLVPFQPGLKESQPELKSAALRGQ